MLSNVVTSFNVSSGFVVLTCEKCGTPIMEGEFTQKSLRNYNKVLCHYHYRQAEDGEMHDHNYEHEFDKPDWGQE